MNSYTKNVNVAFLIRLFLLVLLGNSYAYAQVTASNVCPATTVDLTTHVTETPPSGTLITWHTGTPATQANLVANPTQVGAGLYYAAYFDVATSCYGNTTGSLTVTITACAPINNVCPATTVDLTTHLVGTPPSGTLITWHTGTPATQANRVADPTQVTTGLYYAAYFDVATSCYGNTTGPVSVSIVPCPSPTPDNGAVIAGVGGTAVPNVTTNDLVGGQPVVLGSNATIAPVGTYPPGILLNPATGAVTVANTTAPGTYTLTYQLCTTATTPSCATTTITITVNAGGTTSPDAGTVSAGTGGTAIPNVAANDAVNGVPATLGAAGNATVSPVGTYPPGITLDPATGSVSVAVGTAPGTYTIGYQLCDKLTPVTCSTGLATVTVSPSLTANPDAGTINASSGGTAIPNVAANDVVNGVPATLGAAGNATVSTVGTYPAGITLTPSTGSVSVAVGTAPGTYTVVYQLCDKLTPTTCTTTTATVTVTSSVTAAPDSGTAPATGGTAIPNVAANDVVNGVPATLGATGNATVSTVGTYPAGITLNPATGSLSVAGGTAPGTYTVVYQLCDKLTPATCATAAVAITITPSVTASPDAGTVSAGTGGTAIPNVAVNDVVNGVPATLGAAGNATVSTVGTYPAGITLNPATGAVNAAVGTAPGTYTLVYQLCDKLTPATCTTTTATVTITASVTALPDTGTASSGVAVPNVAANDVVNGVPATLGATGNATVSPVGTYPAGITLDPITGSVSVAVGTMPGTYTVVYQLCDKLTPATCATSVVTITVGAFTNTTPDSGTVSAGAGGTPILNVVANDVVNGLPATLGAAGNATVSPVGTYPAGITLNPATGSVSVAVGTVPGTYTVVYQLCDKLTPVTCMTTTAVVTVTSSLTAGPDSGTVSAGTGGVAVANVTTNDTVNGLPATLGAAGNATVSPVGTYPAGLSLDPATGSVSVAIGTVPGTYTVVYQLCDKLTPTTCTTATVTVTVKPVAPAVTPDITLTQPNTPVVGNVLTNDSDPQGLPLTASVTTPPTAGTVTMAPDGTYTYTPPVNFTGTVSFCYTATNTVGLSASTCVSINVVPGLTTDNGRPVANNDNTQTTSGVPVVIAVRANDVDPDSATALNGQLATPTLVSQPAAGTAIVNANGTITYTPPAGFTGVVSFPYQVCDKATPALCATAVVSVNVQPTPPANTTLAPVAVDDALLTGVNTPVTGTVAANDSDPQGLPLTFTSGQPASGTVVMSPNGSYTYTPAPGYVGPTSFVYLACNSAGKCDVATVDILVQAPPAALPPVAAPDIANTNPNTPVSGNVLTNDSDPQGLPLTVGLLSSPAAGTVTLSPTGSYTYTPPVGFTGVVSFCYSASNSAAQSSSACVTVNVNPVPSPLSNEAPVANSDNTQTTAGVSVTINVVANDTDPDSATTLAGQLAAPVIVSQPIAGTASVVNGLVVYTPPAGFTGVVSFPYQVCDKATPALCATAVVSVNVLPTPPVNTTLAPVAIDDALLLSPNTVATGMVAANDSDPQGLPLTYAPGQPANGVVVMSPAGSYTYTPTPGYIGPDSFTYSVCNSAGKCDVATVSVLVQPNTSLPPVVTPDIANTSPNKPVTGNVLTNDVDPQGAPLMASVTTPPTVGTVVMSPTGSYTYTPPTGFTGTVSFCYTATNTVGLSASTCVSINVVPDLTTDNARPTANNDNTQTTSGVPVVIAVRANDVDPDSATALNGQLATPTLVSQPAAGTAIVNANGTITYTPPAGFTGVVSFPYQVCDKATPALCATAVVSVNVQPTPPANTTLAPVAVDDALLTGVNTPVTGTVAANDSDPQGLPLTFTSGQPASGTVVMSPTGAYTYTPAPGYTGPANFTYSVCNSAGKCDVATVSVLVQQPVNQPPLVTPDVNTFIPGTLTTGNVLTNDKDPEGTPLTASVIGTPPAGFSMSPNGSYTYTAPGSQTAPVTVPVQVCDGATPPACTTSTLTLTPVPNPTPANDRPIALNDATRTTAGVPTTVNVLANDRDPEGLPLSNPTIVSGPTQGTATVNPNGTVTYTPPAGFTGVEQVTYQVCDTGSPVQCTTAVVTFTVDPTPPAGVTNVAPVAIDDQLLTTRNTPVTGTVATNDSDPNAGQTLTFSKLTNPINGTVVFTSTGSYSFVPAPGFVGTDNFTYQVCDSGSPVLCTVATAYITVNAPASLPPVTAPDITLTKPNTPVAGNVLTNDSDPQGLPLTASVTTPPTVGTVVMSPTGSYTYTPPTNFTGMVSFCYTATNTAGLSMNTCVSINVVPDLTTDNARPTANNDNTQTTSGVPVVIAVRANDVDPDSATALNGQLATPTLVSQPAAGTAIVNANGTITYTPPAGFTGVVSFPYQVCDKATPALCATAVVSVNVQPTPPANTTLAPVAVDDALLTGVNTPVTGTVAANDSDPQGLPLTFTSGQPASGTVVMSPTGAYTYTPAPGYTGPANFTYSVCNSAGKCDVATVSVLVQQPVSPGGVVLRLKVLLQGALIGGTGGLMRDDLRSQQFLPLTEPYTALASTRFAHVNGGGGETMPASVTAQNVGTGDAIVDWVFVELRSPGNLSLVVATRSALVQRDGDVVLASDGVSPLSFSGLTGSFYVSVKHRNHLGAMTATSLPLSATGTLVDFTTMTAPQLYNKTIGVYDYEGWEQTTVNGKQALWAGDANHNGKVKYQGTANDLILIFSEVIGAQTGSTNPLYNYNNALGYYFGDVNMDGKVKYQGTSNDTSLIFTNLITNYQTSTQMNSGQLYNFDFMLEQIP
ncbi:Ig-like domain-containing protein [Fibrella arboris]|uniref:Ig-like domain-containing protein n=1 Tax=Fibrella arboris TaxID=3242486 RepID=UPI00352216A2